MNKSFLIGVVTGVAALSFVSVLAFSNNEKPKDAKTPKPAQEEPAMAESQEPAKSEKDAQQKTDDKTSAAKDKADK